MSWFAPRLDIEESRLMTIRIADKVIANKIIELAKAGERNPDLLCEETLNCFSNTRSDSVSIDMLEVSRAGKWTHALTHQRQVLVFYPSSSGYE
jgi:hypothetical protein